MKSLIYDTDAANALKEYLLFLREVGYRVSLCHLGGSFYPPEQIPPEFFCHDNDYCTKIKNNDYAGCAERQIALCSALKENELALSECPAGVKEYVCTASENGETFALICLTGYRGQPTGDREYDALSPDIPSPDRAQAVLRPIVGYIKEIAALHTSDASAPEAVCREIKRLITERLYKRFSVGELCSLVNYSQAYVRRVFKKYTGETVYDYVKRRKISCAKALLAHSCLTAAQIAARLGYPDANYFSTLFKKETGVSPSLYRKQYRNCDRPSPFFSRK